MEQQKSFSDFLEEAAQFVIDTIEAVAEIVVAFVDMVCTSRRGTMKEHQIAAIDALAEELLWTKVRSISDA